MLRCRVNYFWCIQIVVFVSGVDLNIFYVAHTIVDAFCGICFNCLVELWFVLKCFIKCIK